MSWKSISQSVIGTSHLSLNKDCEDASAFKVISTGNYEDVLIGVVSDGAGSANFGGWSAKYITLTAVEFFKKHIESGEKITEAIVYELLEELYNNLGRQAEEKNVLLNEYSATILGAVLYENLAIFFQIGDGAIIRNDTTGFYSPVFYPQNGEYQNTTNFLVDDPAFPALKCITLNESVTEIAIFTDGLQQLALNTVDESVHQPFFVGLFPVLRKAEQTTEQESLVSRLQEYLNSAAINDRTDDDKTLLLATRLPA